MFVAGIDAHATYSVIAIVSNTGQLVLTSEVYNPETPGALTVAVTTGGGHPVTSMDTSGSAPERSPPVCGSSYSTWRPVRASFSPHTGTFPEAGARSRPMLRICQSTGSRDQVRVRVPAS